MGTKPVDEIIDRALELLDEFVVDEELLLIEAEMEEIRKSITEAATKLVEVAQDLPDDVLAKMAFAVGLNQHFYIAYAHVEYSDPYRIIDVMKALGYEYVEDRCLEEHLIRTLRAGWDVAESVAEHNEYSYIVFSLPEGIQKDVLVFRPPD